MGGSGRPHAANADWPAVALERLRLGEALALVTVLAVEGSAPREAGARMLVWATGQWGTVGGGNLEHQASSQARRMLARADAPAFAIQDYPLGPLLAQCCGGRVRLLIEALRTRDAAWLAEADRHGRAAEDYDLRKTLAAGGVTTVVTPAIGGGRGITVNGADLGARGDRPAIGDELVQRVDAALPGVRLFGAGHVGRAVARALAPLPFRLDWHDSRADVASAAGATWTAAEDLASLAAAGARFTLVLTYDHALDYALVSAALSGDGRGYVGLIGSATKRARFTRRLGGEGLGEAALTRLVCPIGLPQISGKDPAVIAASVAADLLIRARTAEDVRALRLQAGRTGGGHRCAGDGA
jgi:xanthine dehydrogenase accessory factor